MSQFYRCFDCSQTSKSKVYCCLKELEAHIASDHLNIFPYECEKCPHARFPTEYALASHKKIDHKLLEFSIKYRYTAKLGEKRQKLAQKLKQCKTMTLPQSVLSTFLKPSDALRHKPLNAFISGHATIPQQDIPEPKGTSLPATESNPSTNGTNNNVQETVQYTPSKK